MNRKPLGGRNISKRVMDAAQKVLRDPTKSKAAKTARGSALTQRESIMPKCKPPKQAYAIAMRKAGKSRKPNRTR